MSVRICKLTCPTYDKITDFFADKDLDAETRRYIHGLVSYIVKANPFIAEIHEREFGCMSQDDINCLEFEIRMREFRLINLLNRFNTWEEKEL